MQKDKQQHSNTTLKIKKKGKKMTLHSQENEEYPMIPEANTTEETQ